MSEEELTVEGWWQELETSRLRLRPWRAAEATVLRQLWVERDPRVPPHRRIDAHGHRAQGRR